MAVRQAADLAARDSAAIDAATTTRADGRDPGVPAHVPLALLDARRVGTPVIAALQRTAGNRAVTEVLQRQRGGTPALPAPTNDQIVAEIGSTLGGPFASYSAFVASMTAGTFLGHTIARGVRPEFLLKLADAEARIDDEYTMSGNRRPANNGISSIGGFRSSAGYHGWGIAIDIDVARNPYVMHEAGEREIDAQVGEVYHRIARIIINRPIATPPTRREPAGGNQHSVIPALIGSGGPMTVGGPTGRRGRAGEYYDRLQLESDAMERYFALMNDQAQLTAFLTTEWPQLHPNEPAPAAADMTRQMWQDFAALGGAIPRGGPPGVTGFTPPAAGAGDRPFNPTSAGQQDPSQGFLTIPREVVLGLSQAVSRWGAIDFGGPSGDVQHFDDGDGALGAAIKSAKSAAARKIRERAAAAAAGSGSGSGASAPTVAQTPIQRRKEPGEGSSEGGVYPAEGPAALTDEERLSGPHWKAIADARWGGATPNIAELESGFGTDLQRFIDMLAANKIVVKLQSGLRPPQRAYLFHYCVKIWKGKIAPKDVPAMDGVDIIWDHGNDAASRKAAEELADKFELVGVAALKSNHSAGTAIDMTMDFSGNTTNTLEYELDGKTVKRTIKVDDEALTGQKNRGKSISGIGKRELSKGGADFGVKRAVDNDIVHWSRSGR
ncbi:MAG TPA: hypothetical protein VGQ64_04755 [Candidatus Limnocylindrales bacterium]|nr:hypothetical protein [Candidatus Limnocylindrales bacterium]